MPEPSKKIVRFPFFSRMLLFLATNLAVIILLGFVLRVLGVEQLLAEQGIGLQLGGLLAFAAVFGFAGSLISLATSKRVALWSTKARVLQSPSGDTERWLVETVHRQADAAGIGRPDVAIWDAPEPNAFATGARRNAALVAVSTGLLRGMGKREVEAVLAHEIAHVANGDMITMALMQGVVNTFVIFLSRAVGLVIDRVVFRTRRGRGIGYWISVFVLEMVFGLLASILVMGFSRRREYRADAGGAALAGKGAMISALQALQRTQGQPVTLPQNMAAMGIRGDKVGGLRRLLRTHPDLDDRIRALDEAD
jgi:heat shock protein HtpX